MDILYKAHDIDTSLLNVSFINLKHKSYVVQDLESICLHFLPSLGNYSFVTVQSESLMKIHMFWLNPDL